MKRYAPLIFAALLLAFGALSQTTYLGNILQMHRQVEPLPSPTNYQGSIVYNLDAGSLYFSNGTTWAAIGSGSGGSSAGYWFDAGAMVFDGGLAGIYAAPIDLQVRVGVQDPFMLDFNAGTSLPSRPRNAALYVFGDVFDAGVAPSNNSWNAITAHTRHSGDITRSQFLTTGTAYTGANVYIFSDRRDGGSGVGNYAQLAFQTSNGVGSATEGTTITEYYPRSGLDFRGGDGAFFKGLNIHSANNITFSTGGNSSAFPNFFITSGGRFAMGATDTSGTSMFTLDQGGANPAFFIKGSAGTGIGFQNSGTDLDLGAGTNDYLESDGTRVAVGPLTAGGISSFTYRVAGNAGASTTVTSTTSGNGSIGFNQASGTHYMMSTNKEARPILSGPDWVFDGRTFEVEVTHELTSCPVARKTASRLGAGGGDVTVFCSDAAAATVTVGAGHPAQPYRNFVTGAAGGDRSIFGGFTTSAPASGAGATPQTFVSRQAGPVFSFRLRTGSANWTSNVTWYAGLFSSIPASGSPYGSSVYLRFDTNNPLPSSTADTRFRLCACSSGTCSCSNLSVAPAVSTEYLFTVDCRESSTVCYAYMNGLYETSVSTNLPSTSTPMGFAFAIENVDAAARTAGLGRLVVRQE